MINAQPDPACVVWESPDFLVFANSSPLVDRDDGGHIIIQPKERLVDRQELNPRQAIECMRLTMIVGEAMIKVMNRRGVDIGRINYQDNSNWSVFSPGGPYFHLHLYGRAKSAKIQPYGHSLSFPLKENYPELYENLKPLTPDDVGMIREEVVSQFGRDKYQDSAWKLCSQREKNPFRF